MTFHGGDDDVDRKVWVSDSSSTFSSKYDDDGLGHKKMSPLW